MIRRAWLRLESRLQVAPFETPIAAWFAVIAWVGIVSLQGVVPPTLAAALPAWLVQVWTVSLALGGTLTVLGVLRASSRTESAGLILMGWGLTLYGGCLMLASWPGGVTAAAAFIGCAFGCVIRLRVLRRDRRAREVARLILTHTHPPESDQ